MSIEALKASIIKWERNAKAERIEDLEMGANTCQLCDEYNERGVEEDCMGCPVTAYTGSRYCLGTPYERVFKLANQCSVYDPVDEELSNAVRDELDFLKSLLDPAEIAARLEEWLALPDLDDDGRQAIERLQNWQKELEA